MKYPLLLKFTGTTIGTGFVASVSFTGRFVGEKTGDEWWLYGVNPSAIAEHGDSLVEANHHLRDAIQESLAWLASQATTFEQFKGQVKDFVYATNAQNEVEWSQAVDRVRATKANLEDLPIWGAAMAVCVHVSRKSEKELSPSDNSPRAELGKAAKAA